MSYGMTLGILLIRTSGLYGIFLQMYLSVLFPKIWYQIIVSSFALSFWVQFLFFQLGFFCTVLSFFERNLRLCILSLFQFDIAKVWCKFCITKFFYNNFSCVVACFAKLNKSKINDCIDAICFLCNDIVVSWYIIWEFFNENYRFLSIIFAVIIVFLYIKIGITLVFVTRNIVHVQYLYLF